MGVYLDHAATSGMSEAARGAYIEASGQLGNPSSLHSFGRAARAIVEDARESIAADLVAHPTEVVFTAGGTESNNLAVKGIYWACVERDAQRRALSVSAVEHHSVLEPARWLAKCGAVLEMLPVDNCGIVGSGALHEILQSTTAPFALVSVMLANNEIGAIQPIASLAEIAHNSNALFHTDAVAALGQIPVSFTGLGVDTLSVAAHKIGGPIGVGALLVKRGIPLEPLVHGGDQERGLRAGTINVPGVAAFAAALRSATVSLGERQPRIASLRDKLIAGVLASIPTAKLTGPDPVVHPLDRIPGNASFIFPGCDPDALLFGLDRAGFAASIGAACAAGVAGPSEVLLACGFDDAAARSSIRFTLGATASGKELAQLIELLPSIVAAARVA